MSEEYSSMPDSGSPSEPGSPSGDSAPGHEGFLPPSLQKPSGQSNLESVSDQPTEGFNLDSDYYNAVRSYYRGEPYDQKYAPQEQYEPQYTPPVYEPADLIGDFLSANSETSDIAFMHRLYNSNPAAYERIAHYIIRDNAEYISERLGMNRNGVALSSEELRSIPQHLHSTASNMRADLWEELSMMPERQRNSLLEAEKERQDLRRQNEEYEQYYNQIAAQQIQQQHIQAVQRISDHHETRHRDVLDAWSPCGADMEANRALRESALHAVMMDMGKSQHQQQRRQQAIELLQEAAQAKASGNYQHASDCEAYAQHLAEQWNKAFSVRLEKYMNALGRAYSQQSSNVPDNRKYSDVRVGSKPPLSKDGSMIMSDEYKSWLAQQRKKEEV